MLPLSPAEIELAKSVPSFVAAHAAWTFECVDFSTVLADVGVILDIRNRTHEGFERLLGEQPLDHWSI